MKIITDKNLNDNSIVVENNNLKSVIDIKDILEDVEKPVVTYVDTNYKFSNSYDPDNIYRDSHNILSNLYIEKKFPEIHMMSASSGSFKVKQTFNKRLKNTNYFLCTFEDDPVSVLKYKREQDAIKLLDNPLLELLPYLYKFDSVEIGNRQKEKDIKHHINDGGSYRLPRLHLVMEFDTNCQDGTETDSNINFKFVWKFNYAELWSTSKDYRDVPEEFQEYLNNLYVEQLIGDISPYSEHGKYEINKWYPVEPNWVITEAKDNKVVKSISKVHFIVKVMTGIQEIEDDISGGIKNIPVYFEVSNIELNYNEVYTMENKSMFVCERPM